MSADSSRSLSRHFYSASKEADMIRAGLDGPSRRIIVQPQEQPSEQPHVEPAPSETPEREPEKVPA